MNELVITRVCFWNINGRTHLLQCIFIHNWLRSNFEIVFITETHLKKSQPFELKDFIVRHNSYSTIEDLKPRGGIFCFVKPSYLKYVTSVKTDIPDNIIVNFKNGDVIFGTYIAASDSPYYNTTEFSNVANMFIPLNYNRVLFGGGDLNGRVGDIRYSLPSKTMEYLPNVDKVLNDHGKEILKICR